MLVASLRRISRPALQPYLFRTSPSCTRSLFQTPACHFRQSSLFRNAPVVEHRQSQSPAAPLIQEKATPQVEGDTFINKVGKPRIRSQLLFVGFTSLFAFGFAAVWTSAETDFWKTKLTTMSKVWNVSNITNVDLKRVQTAELVKRLREWYSYINVKLANVPGVVRPWLSLAYITVFQPYADASEGKRLCWKICLLNAGVWLAWKVGRWQGPMKVSFMHHPLSGLSYTLITSVFSHKSFLHLLFNCVALEGFGSAAYFYLLKEQDKQQKADPPVLESTSSYHFLAFYLSAGMFAGLVSHIVATKFQYPRLVAQIASDASRLKKTDTWAAAVSASTETAAKATVKKTASDILPSLGASGAIYATVVMTALAFPNSEVALFIPPSYPINIQYGVGALVALDMVGVWRKWRMFDHWAHLGGAAFGAAYYYYGPTIWAAMRRNTSLDEIDS